MFKASETSRRQFMVSGLSTMILTALSKTASAQSKDSKGAAMPSLTPYLLFDGSCERAMEFYKDCFGGELAVTKVKDSPVKDHMPAAAQERVLNARLRSADVDISASDWLAANQTPVRGNTVCMYLSGGTFQQLSTLFGKLSEGAQVADPLKKQFFGTYGALNDKFGVRWMFQTNSTE